MRTISCVVRLNGIPCITITAILSFQCRLKLGTHYTRVHGPWARVVGIELKCQWHLQMAPSAASKNIIPFEFFQIHLVK